MLKYSFKLKLETKFQNVNVHNYTKVGDVVEGLEGCLNFSENKSF